MTTIGKTTGTIIVLLDGTRLFAENVQPQQLFLDIPEGAVSGEFHDIAGAFADIKVRYWVIPKRSILYIVESEVCYNS